MSSGLSKSGAKGTPVGVRNRSKVGRRRRALKLTVLSTVVVLMLIGGCGTFLYFKLNGNLTTVDFSSLRNRPPKTAADAQGHTPLNILFLGSQTRDGQIDTQHILGGTPGTDLSDTSFLVHINAGRKWAVVASIPRDLVVPRPECPKRNGSGTVPASSADMFDAAMNYGGPECAVATTEAVTHIRVDHFIRMDFNGFRKIINELGGVQVCVPEPGIKDLYHSHLDIAAGMQTVTGEQALAFVRNRHGIGDGSDLGRIVMQQMFMTSLINKAQSSDILTDPVKMYKLANTGLSSLTVDSELGSVSKILSLAKDLKHIDRKNISFITVPSQISTQDENRVIPSPGFNAVWQLLRNDQPLTTSPHNSDSVAPSSIKVSVYNGTTTLGQAAVLANRLRNQGVQATVSGNQAGPHPTTEILYGEGQENAAKTLATMVPGAQIKPSESAQSLILIVGSNALQKASPAASVPPVPPNMQTRKGDQNLCSGLPKP